MIVIYKSMQWKIIELFIPRLISSVIPFYGKTSKSDYNEESFNFQVSWNLQKGMTVKKGEVGFQWTQIELKKCVTNLPGKPILDVRENTS